MKDVRDYTDTPTMTPKAYVQYKQYIQYSTVPPSCWRGTSCGWEGYLFLSGSVLASGPIASPNLLNRAFVVAPRPEQWHRLVRQPLYSQIPHSNRLSTVVHSHSGLQDTILLQLLTLNNLSGLGLLLRLGELLLLVLAGVVILLLLVVELLPLVVVVVEPLLVVVV